MPSLYWDIEWRWGAHPLDRDTKRACEQVILNHLLRSGKSFGSDDVGFALEGLTVSVAKDPVEFSAILNLIDPLEGCRVDRWTNINVIDPNGRGGTAGPSPDQDLENFILRRVTFDPVRLDQHYMDLYDSLIGTEKEMILEEAASLLAPVNVIQEWGIRHYGGLPPILRTAVSKAPVIIFGGDPGTGKTALASSMGAPLSRLLKEKIHFRHISLSIRGMGFQGRASTLINKFFKEYINEEYSQLREPMIVFFDEAESVVGSRDQIGGDSGAIEDLAIVNAIIVGLDSLRKGIRPRVIVMFATNIIGRIDAALMRRCYYHSFERPDEQTRRALLKSSLQGLGLDDTALSTLVEATRPRVINGSEIAFTHSDIVELIIVRAVNAAIRMNKPVTLDLLLDCCQRTTPTRSLLK